MTCGIYLLTNTVNGKVYVGQSKNCEMRFRQHVKESKRGRLQTALYNSMRKHGHQSFVPTVIEAIEGATQGQLDDRETHWIKHYSACSPESGYNFRPGGQMGQVVDAEARERIASKLRGRKQPTELVEKNRQGHIGIPCSEAAKAKIGAFHAGKCLDKKTADAIKAEINAQFDKPVEKRSAWTMPQEIRAKVSARFKGKPKSEETRRRMSEARKNSSPESEARRIAVLRAVTQARWAKHREAQATGVAK